MQCSRKELCAKLYRRLQVKRISRRRNFFSDRFEQASYCSVLQAKISSLTENQVKTNMRFSFNETHFFCPHKLMCHCSNLYHVYSNIYNNNYLFVVLISLQPFCKSLLYGILLIQLFAVLLTTFL